jgi:hypothetical protein
MGIRSAAEFFGAAFGALRKFDADRRQRVRHECC